MDRRQFLKMVSASVLSAACVPSIVDAREKNNKPNILLIMADDMGYSDIGFYGGEINTPNLDSLAKGGIRFTQFYNCAKCSPTRASLLTGQYDQAVGVRNMENGATFAEVLRGAGYRTIASGKWHQSPLPTTRGFDRYFGLADGCCNFWNPGTKARPGEGAPGRKKTTPRRWAIEGKAIMGYVPQKKDFYTTDAFTQYAIDRLDEYENEDKPILLYLPFTAPHYPLHAWPEDIAKYRGKYMAGWDSIRERRYKRQIEIGMLDPKFGNSPRDERVKKWDSLSKSQQDAEDLKMAVYAAMIERMDYGIGRVFAKLKEIGRWQNTLVLFLSDNGGCAETPDTTPNIPPGPVEGYRALGPAWANASNTPYRKYKSTDYEGGNCTPFIATGLPSSSRDKSLIRWAILSMFCRLSWISPELAIRTKLTAENLNARRASPFCPFSRAKRERPMTLSIGSSARERPSVLVTSNLSNTVIRTGSYTTWQMTGPN
ncbi:MAG TPA: sulfatase-like hydrolase/transferase [Planctomycetes bacterium]|nr:sulfatase-like hydrolase/transferase [Planctomycetota bacterium]